MKQAWRHLSLAGFAAGLGLAPLIGPLTGSVAGELGAVALAAPLLALARPRGCGWLAGCVWLALVALAGAGIGLGLGSLRLAAIDAGALRAEPGESVQLEGWLSSAPRSGPEGMEAELESGDGRVMLRAAQLGDHSIGDGIRVRGRLAPPAPWRAGSLARRGIAMTLEAERVESTGEARRGLSGRVDAIRARAERALGRGVPDREAALARGFVLGQDDGIDPRTREDFRRSGLTHLLAVSGQNVILLCLLAWPLLALLGLNLRARLLALLCLIAIYVPVTGAGPSIQRAAVMGGAGLVAALADRSRSGWYALLLAAAATLALNPRASGDIGWQLSFAAVAGIFLWTGRLAGLIDGGAGRASPRRALAEGLAMTAAATVATAPLMAHHFGALSLSSLAANALALPAVAPAMWLGMLGGMAGQLPSLPVEPLNWLNSLCLAYIAQVASWLGSPAWAQAEVELGSPAAVAVSYLFLVTLAELCLRFAQRRRGLRLGAGGRWRSRAPRLAAIAGLLVACSVVAGARGEGGDAASDDRLVVRVLDVGQGDSILLDPPLGEPILVDTGPPGGEVAARLTELGIRSLGALVVTHDQSDHAGGVPELVRALTVRRLALARGSRPLAALAAATGAERVSAWEGGELRSGELRLSVLWPPHDRLGGAAEDANALSLVLLAEWRHFSLLLTGDAEAEAAPVNPGPVDVLKVAHHGSEDEGLGPLLEQTVPKLALISVGENPYGHPTPETLGELVEHGVPVARTDRSGELVIEADAEGWWLRPR